MMSSLNNEILISNISCVLLEISAMRKRHEGMKKKSLEFAVKIIHRKFHGIL